MKRKLSKLESVPLREAWKHEAAEFTPWLAKIENFDSLPESLGISGFVFVPTEHWDESRKWTPSSRLAENSPD